MDLKAKIASIEKQMVLKLEEIRATHKHKGIKGGGVEQSFREFLSEYLPRRFTVGQGEVVDSAGSVSAQTDIVIASDDHPFTFTPDESGLFFVEGVCAAGEVKALLNGAELTKSINNSKLFKQLDRKTLKGRIQFTNPTDEARYYTKPPWFLFAVESELTIETTKEKIEAALASHQIESNERVDAVFALGRGWVINFGEGTGSFQLRSTDGQRAKGWVAQKSENVLFDFLAWLSVVMPREVNLSPILPLYMLANTYMPGQKV